MLSRRDFAKSVGVVSSALCLPPDNVKTFDLDQMFRSFITEPLIGNVLVIDHVGPEYKPLISTLPMTSITNSGRTELELNTKIRPNPDIGISSKDEYVNLVSKLIDSYSTVEYINSQVLDLRHISKPYRCTCIVSEKFTDTFTIDGCFVLKSSYLQEDNIAYFVWDSDFFGAVSYKDDRCCFHIAENQRPIKFVMSLPENV